MNDSDQVLSVLFCVPFLNPLELLPGQYLPIIKTYVYSEINIPIQLKWLVMVELFVFILILIPKCREITEYSRSCCKASRSLAIEKLLVRKTTFNHYSVVFVLHKSKVIIMFYKLRKYKCRNLTILQFFCLGH